MKRTDVRCPVCGTMNRSLFLEETEGNYECEGCGYCGTIEGYRMRILRAGEMKRETAAQSANRERLTPLTV